MPSQTEIMETLKTLPDGGDISTLAESLKVKPFQLTAGLAALRKKGSVLKEGEIYRLADAVVKPLEKPKIETPLLPNDFDAFVGLGVTCGIEANFATAIADYIFQGDAYDLDITYERLRGLHLRQDTLSRLLSMWASAIGKPIPLRVAEATTPASTTATPVKEVKWVIIAGKPVPDSTGPYTFNQALQIVESQGKSQSGDSSLTDLLINQLNQSNARIESMLQSQQNEKFQNLAARLDAVSADRKEANRFGVLQTSVDKVGVELSGWRADVKSLVPTFLAARGATIKHRTEEEKAKFSQGLDKGIERSKAATEAENRLWPELTGASQQGVVVVAPPPAREAPPACFSPGYVSGVYGCGEVKRGDPTCQKCSYASK